MDRNRKIVMLTGAVLGGMLLAGVASPAMAAQPTATSAATQSVHVSGHEGPVKGLAAPVIARIVNTSNAPVTVEVNGYGMTGKRQETLAIGQTLGVVGHAWSGHDIEGTVTYADGSKVAFWFNNPYVGDATAGFGDGSNWDYYDETEQIPKVQDGHAFTVVREHDQQIETAPYKIFAMSINS